MNARIKSYSSFIVSSPVGSPTRDKYIKRIVEGKETLVKVGQIDQQGIINSYKDECDVRKLVERHQNGDISALARVQGIYCDISGFSNDATELMNSAIIANNTDFIDNLTENVSDNNNNNIISEESEVNESNV